MRKLTPRRLDVLDAVAKGLTNKEIAVALGISEQAVKVHVSTLLLHFGVTTRTALARSAARDGIIEWTNTKGSSKIRTDRPPDRGG